MSTTNPFKILLVGDSPIENIGLKNALNVGGWKTTSTINLHEAKQIIAKNWPDAVIFSFYELTTAEAWYSDLLFVSAESTCELNNAILLCRLVHEAQAYDQCLNGFFFMYLVERPLTSEFSLRQAVHLLQEKMAARQGVQKAAVDGGRSVKIMVVEDEDMQRKLIEKMLKTLGHAVSTAADGQHALDMLENETVPNLVLMDIRMPRMDGFETITRIKQHPEWQKIPIIILSSNRDIESVTTGIKKGAVDFIVKPVSKLILKKKLDSHLS
ncbi:MAG: response regulator [Methylococcaceae bacterium]